MLAPVTLWLAGVPGALLAAAGIALAPAWRGRLRWPVTGVLALVRLVFALLALLNSQKQAPLGITISPYKGLAQALRYPGSERRFGAWNAFARVDVVGDAGTRQLPGLSYTYPAHAPSVGAGGRCRESAADHAGGPRAICGGAPICRRQSPSHCALQQRHWYWSLPVGLACCRRLPGGAAQVTAVVDNPLERVAVAAVAPEEDVYADPRVRVVFESGRVFTQQDKKYAIRSFSCR